MMKTRITTTDEIKAFLGINGSTKDAQIDLWHDIATEMLCDFLGVEQLVQTAYTNKKVKPVLNYYEMHGSFFSLPNFPIDVTSITMKDGTFNAISSPPDSFFVSTEISRNVRAKNADGTAFGYGLEEYFVDYTAGFTIKDTLEITTNPTAGQKFVVRSNGVTTEYEFVDSDPTGNQIEIGGDEEATATAIATKIGGTVSGATVTGLIGMIFESITDGTITNANIPRALKAAIAYLVGGGLVEKTKAGGVSNYSIGQKSVTFRNTTEKTAFETVLKTYVTKFKKIRIVS